MINSVIVRTVDTCASYRWTTIMAGTLLMLGAGAFAAAKFSINTDVEGLISQALPWHQRQLKMSEAFPQNGISVVVKAPTTENAELATKPRAARRAKQRHPVPLAGHARSGECVEPSAC